MSEHVLIERPARYAGAIQVIRLNRPEKKNAITRAMYPAMTAALKEADADAAIRVNVFLGVPGAFSAGNDLNDFLAFAAGGALGAEIVEFLHALALSRKPLVSGVDGLAVGIGTTLHLHCDLTYATPRTAFSTPFVDLALVPEAGSSLLAPRIMGHQRAFALLAAGERLPAEAAREAGLIAGVVGEDALEATVLAAAERLAAKPPEALRIARDLLRGPRDDIIARIDEEAALFGQRLTSAEARAAFEAFLARKRS